MSGGDPVQDMVDALAATRRDVTELRKLVDAKAPGADVVRGVQAELGQLKAAIQSVQPQAVLDAATMGAKAAKAEIGEATAALRTALSRIQGQGGSRWRWKALVGLLAALTVFLGGVVAAPWVTPKSLLGDVLGAYKASCEAYGGRWYPLEPPKSSVNACAFYGPR